eukprot:8468476-Ditylum_brightwellii.AAC.1
MPDEANQQRHHRGVVSKLHVPNPEPVHSPAIHDNIITSLKFDHTEPHVVIVNQDEKMSRLIAKNKLHLHQAFDTPFVHPDMQQYIG